jgi:hypothetical protein
MAQNTEQEGWGTEHWNLDEKLNAERDMETENIMVDTEKMAVMEMEETLEEMSVENIKAETAAETTEEAMKRTGEMQEMEMEIENKTEELESVADLYQNRCNTCQMDGEMILYTSKRKKLNQE